MTVVEAYVCGRKVDAPYNKSLLPPKLTSLLIEGIAQNTTGSVFIPEVGVNLVCSEFFHEINFVNKVVETWGCDFLVSEWDVRVSFWAQEIIFIVGYLHFIYFIITRFCKFLNLQNNLCRWERVRKTVTGLSDSESRNFGMGLKLMMFQRDLGLLSHSFYLKKKKTKTYI